MTAIVPRADLSGQAYGLWTVLRFTRALENGKGMWLCRCACSAHKEVEGYNLTSGRSRSCRKCSAAAAGAERRTHGASRGLIYRRWQAMKSRCYNPKAKGYADYGGRGIRVADEWLKDFAAFHAHIGDPPTELHTVDRMDPFGHYAPGNVRWVTQGEQMENTRRAKRYADRRIEERLAELRGASL